MYFSREHRLLGYSAAQLQAMGVKDTTTQYTSRTAQANAQEQVKNSSQVITPGVNAPVDYVPPTPPTSNPVLQAAKTTYADQSAGKETAFTPATGQTTAIPQPSVSFNGLSGTAAQMAQQRQAERLAKINAINVTKDVQVGTTKNGIPIYSKQTDEAATQAAKDAEKQRQMQEDQNLQTSFQQNIKDSQTAGGSTSDAETHFQNLVKETAKTDPQTAAQLQLQHAQDTAQQNQPLAGIMAGLDPKIAAGLQGYFDKMNAHATDIQAKMDQGTVDTTTGTATLQKIKDDAIATALQQQQDSLAFGEKQDALNRQAVENAQKDANDIIERNQAQANLNEHIAYHNQEVQNTETEMQNRNLAAKLGINYDTGGLKWMQMQQQKGVDALGFISQQMALNSADFANQSLKVVRDYTQNTFTASQDALAQYNQTNKTYNDSVNNAKANYSAGVTSLRQYNATLQEKYVSDIKDIDQNVGNTYKDLVDKMIEQHTAALNRAATNQYRDAVLGLRKEAIQASTGKFDMNLYSRWSKQTDTQKARIQNDLNNSPAIQGYQDFYLKQSEVTSVMDSLGGGETMDPVKATALEDLFSRAFTTGSRVPVALVGMLKENESPLQHFQGIISQYQGQGKVPPEIVSEISAAVKASGDMLQQNATKAAQTILMRIGGVNRKIPSEFSDVGLKMSDFSVPNLTLPTDDVNNYLQGSSGGGNGWDAPEDWSDSPDESFSPSAMRTDRNNNPTAMTTDVAKNAGLIEGQDYVQGDAFPDNKNLFTAKLLGDPIETTIKAIDTAGFTTKSGQSRWTYTKDLGLSNATWSDMSHDEKVNAIAQMYKREGGNGSLFAQKNFSQSPVELA